MKDNFTKNDFASFETFKKVEMEIEETYNFPRDKAFGFVFSISEKDKEYSWTIVVVYNRDFRGYGDVEIDEPRKNSIKKKHWKTLNACKQNLYYRLMEYFAPKVWNNFSFTSKTSNIGESIK